MCPSCLPSNFGPVRISGSHNGGTNNNIGQDARPVALASWPFGTKAAPVGQRRSVYFELRSLAFARIPMFVLTQPVGLLGSRWRRLKIQISLLGRTGRQYACAAPPTRPKLTCCSDEQRWRARGAPVRAAALRTLARRA